MPEAEDHGNRGRDRGRAIGGREPRSPGQLLLQPGSGRSTASSPCNPTDAAAAAARPKQRHDPDFDAFRSGIGDPSTEERAADADEQAEIDRRPSPSTGNADAAVRRRFCPEAGCHWARRSRTSARHPRDDHRPRSPASSAHACALRGAAARRRRRSRLSGHRRQRAARRRDRGGGTRAARPAR